MLIKKIELIVLSLPLKKIFKTSFGEIDNRDTLIVKLYSNNDFVGYGESSLLKYPISENETIETGIKLIQEKISSKILNKNFSETKDIYKILQNFKNNPVTIIGLEAAFYDLISQYQNKYVGEFFNSTQEVLRAGESIGIIFEKEELLKETQRFIKKGYKRIKYKICSNYNFDIFFQIRKKFPELEICLDANQSLKSSDLQELLKLEQLNLSMLEQPFEADEIDLHSELQKKVKFPVCVDESVKSFDDANIIKQKKAAKIINIKPARIGSYYESKKIHDFCFQNNIDLFIGGRLESGIGKAMNLALASAPGFNIPIDLSSSLEFFKDDIIEPLFETNNGKINVPNNKKGLGFEINEKKIEKYTKYKLNIT